MTVNGRFVLDRMGVAFYRVIHKIVGNINGIGTSVRRAGKRGEGNMIDSFRKTNLAAISGVVGTVFLTAAGAQAAPVSLPQTVITGLGTTWFVQNGAGSGTAFAGDCDASGFHINDATSTTGDGDMYDDAFGIWIDDVAFSAPDPVDLTGNTITAGPASLSGLNVTVAYEFSDSIEAVRSTVTLENPSGSAISVGLDIANNFGSDSSTTIVDTSSGDTVFTTTDTWVVTWDTSSEINTTAITTPGGGLTPDSVTDTVFNCAGSQGFGASYTVNVPAASSLSLVFSGGIAEIDGDDDDDPTEAIAGIPSLLSFAGTGSTTAPSGPAEPVPAIPVGLLLMLGTMVGYLGSLSLRSSKRSAGKR